MAKTATACVLRSLKSLWTSRSFPRDSTR
jgi:hypothetical protein